MASTIFTDFVTPVPAAWLNDVNTATYVTVPANSAAIAALQAAAVTFPSGTIIDFSGTTAPTGFLACPTVATNISRATYAALFAAIGTTWGAGDGATTFGMPWFPADYTSISGVPGTNSVGQVLAHTHVVNNTIIYQPGLGAGLYPTPAYASASNPTTTSTGGAANLAAGVRVLKCVKT